MTLPYADIDILLIDVNFMYLSVYTTMIMEIVFFFIFIRALSNAIKEQ